MRGARWYFLLWRMGVACCLLFAAGTSGNALAREPGETNEDLFSMETEILYGQTPEVWSALQGLLQAQGSVVRLYNALDGRYGQSEEAFSIIKSRITVARSLYLEARIEGVGWGLTENPVVSKLHGRGLVAGELAFGFSGEFLGKGTRTRIGGLLGSGLGRRTDGVSSDFVEEFSVKHEDLKIHGLDLEITKESRKNSSGVTTGASALLQETVFLSSLGYRFQAHRWKLMFYTGNVRSQQTPSGLGFHAIAGPQPIPQEILPRVWDYAHETNFLPDLESLLGAGVDIRFPITKDTSLTGVVGFYGDYWGGAITIQGHGKNSDQNSGGMIFKLGSWGIGTSPLHGYLGERLWIGSLGWRL